MARAESEEGEVDRDLVLRRRRPTRTDRGSSRARRRRGRVQPDRKLDRTVEGADVPSADGDRRTEIADRNDDWGRREEAERHRRGWPRRETWLGSDRSSERHGRASRGTRAPTMAEAGSRPR